MLSWTSWPRLSHLTLGEHALRFGRTRSFNHTVLIPPSHCHPGPFHEGQRGRDICGTNQNCIKFTLTLWKSVLKDVSQGIVILILVVSGMLENAPTAMCHDERLVHASDMPFSRTLISLQIWKWYRAPSSVHSTQFDVRNSGRN
jgi:hypothetical protein